MKVVVQKVVSALVKVDGKVISKINKGLLVFLGIEKNDSSVEQDYIINKILKLRIFLNGDDKSFEKNVVDIDGEVLLVPQFTLYGDCTKGNRPSFYQSMDPKEALNMYNAFANRLKVIYPRVHEGVFGAKMQVELVNDGPNTFVIQKDHS